MARALDVATKIHLGDAAIDGLMVRDFIYIFAKDMNGNSVEFGFWNDAEDINIQVIDAQTGVSIARTFYGGTIEAIPSIPLTTGFDFQNTTIKLNAHHPQVKNLLRNNNARAARVDVYRGVFDADTHLIASQPTARFAGKIDLAKIEIAQVGGNDVAQITAASFRRELTKSIALKKSDEFYKTRLGDRFGRYESQKQPVQWGEYQEEQKEQGKSGIFGMGWWIF